MTKMGANHVVGVDLDPVVVDSAKENVALNNLNNIEILEGNLMDVVEGKGDLIIANILAEIIVILVDQVKDCLKKGGIFIASGIIKDRENMVAEKLKNSGFAIKETLYDGEWVCIVSEYL